MHNLEISFFVLKFNLIVELDPLEDQVQFFIRVKIADDG
jgi:hypothetical protein